MTVILEHTGDAHVPNLLHSKRVHSLKWKSLYDEIYRMFKKINGMENILLSMHQYRSDIVCSLNSNLLFLFLTRNKDNTNYIFLKH